MPATTFADGVYVGVMSGTSLDGVDLVLARFSPRFELIDTLALPFPPELRQAALALCVPGADEIDRMGRLDRELGDFYADAILQLLARHRALRDSLVAVGCHGQTVRHRPGPGGFSLQLGSPDAIASRTGLATVTDFRNHDLVLGGEGAPLVPAFHAAVCSQAGQRRAVVNVGGMANITVLDGSRVAGGYDTGPGNVLLDAWCQRHLDRPCDLDGGWAGQGRVLEELLARLLEEPYFIRRPPKSTGREHFNLEWLLVRLQGQEAPVDVQATLSELTATTIAGAVREADVEGAWICGGGARNGDLMQRLARLLAPLPCTGTDALGLPPESVEAAAFAWLARARMLGEPGNVPEVTGASRPAVLGALYLP